MELVKKYANERHGHYVMNITQILHNHENNTTRQIYANELYSIYS